MDGSEIFVLLLTAGGVINAAGAAIYSWWHMRRHKNKDLEVSVTIRTSGGQEVNLVGGQVGDTINVRDIVAEISSSNVKDDDREG